MMQRCNSVTLVHTNLALDFKTKERIFPQPKLKECQHVLKDSITRLSSILFPKIEQVKWLLLLMVDLESGRGERGVTGHDKRGQGVSDSWVKTEVMFNSR